MFNNETLLNSIVDKWSKSELTNESLSGLGFMGQPSGPTVCSADLVKGLTVPDHLEMVTDVPKTGIVVGAMIEFRCAEYDQVFDPKYQDNLDPDGNGLFGLLCLADGTFGAAMLPSESHCITYPVSIYSFIHKYNTCTHSFRCAWSSPGLRSGRT